MKVLNLIFTEPEKTITGSFSNEGNDWIVLRYPASLQLTWGLSHLNQGVCESGQTSSPEMLVSGEGETNASHLILSPH